MKSNEHSSPPKPKVLIVGGFLGAGKTTLIRCAVRRLQALDIQCGIVTNDQAQGLVDSTIARSLLHESAVQEVAGGCFCCRLEQLVDRLRLLTEELSKGVGKSGGRNVVIIAEPVGSCTDLLATVLLPLQRVYSVDCSLAPLNVVLDSRRALSALGGRNISGCFSKDVSYIYRKQIEEAEVLLLNKADLMAAEDLGDLESRLANEFPDKKKFTISAKNGYGIEAWIDYLMGKSSAVPRNLMEVDYKRYAAGEAELGWLNLSAKVRGLGGEDGDSWILQRAMDISRILEAEGIETAHFKMTLEDEARHLRAVSYVLRGTVPELTVSMPGNFSTGRLNVNLRAAGQGKHMLGIVEKALEPWTINIVSASAFQPSEPVPTSRVLSL